MSASSFGRQSTLTKYYPLVVIDDNGSPSASHRKKSKTPHEERIVIESDSESDSDVVEVEVLEEPNITTYVYRKMKSKSLVFHSHVAVRVLLVFIILSSPPSPTSILGL